MCIRDRLISRPAPWGAEQSFTVSEFKKQMAEVYTTSVNKATLDECPMAYKGMQDILDNIGPCLLYTSRCIRDSRGTNHLIPESFSAVTGLTYFAPLLGRSVS